MRPHRSHAFALFLAYAAISGKGSAPNSYSHLLSSPPRPGWDEHRTIWQTLYGTAHQPPPAGPCVLHLSQRLPYRPASPMGSGLWALRMRGVAPALMHSPGCIFAATTPKCVSYAISPTHSRQHACARRHQAECCPPPPVFHSPPFCCISSAALLQQHQAGETTQLPRMPHRHQQPPRAVLPHPHPGDTPEDLLPPHLG